MVRFSDIIKGNASTEDSGESKNKETEEDRIWLSDSPALESDKDPLIADVSDTSLTDMARQEMKKHYESFLKRAIEIKDRVKNNQGISPSPVLKDLHFVLDHNLVDPLYEYAMSAPDKHDPMLIQTIATTLAALRVGEGLGYDTKRLLTLGLAAFLNDVGMYRIPEGLLNKKGKLSARELEVIRKHPEMGAHILVEMGKSYRSLGEIALQTHERSDGSGYPKGLKKGEISELASIIGLIDTYVALIKNRPYRDKVVQTDAVKFIIKEAKGLFPHKVIKAFLDQISLFPVNTYVKLNNQAIGRVLSTDRRQPLKPMIQLLYDSDGLALGKGEIIRLADNPLLHIVESISEADLK